MTRPREPLPTRVTDLPMLPPGFYRTLDDGLAVLGLDEIPPSVRTALADHARLLLRWTAAINLTAIRDPVAVAREHILDSVAALPLLRARGIDRLVDLGSGPGYPGLALAIALPARQALLVDSIRKKAAFLEVAVGATGMDGVARVAATRAETLARGPDRGAWPAVTARALASLVELVELAFPLLARGGVLVSWKRIPLDAELRDARRALPAMGGGPLEIHPIPVPGLEDHRLVVATKIRATPTSLPRDAAARRQRPLLP